MSALRARRRLALSRAVLSRRPGAYSSPDDDVVDNDDDDDDDGDEDDDDDDGDEDDGDTSVCDANSGRVLHCNNEKAVLPVSSVSVTEPVPFLGRTVGSKRVTVNRRRKHQATRVGAQVGNGTNLLRPKTTKDERGRRRRRAVGSGASLTSLRRKRDMWGVSRAAQRVWARKRNIPDRHTPVARRVARGSEPRVGDRWCSRQHRRVVGRHELSDLLCFHRKHAR